MKDLLRSSITPQIKLVCTRISLIEADEDADTLTDNHLTFAPVVVCFTLFPAKQETEICSFWFLFSKVLSTLQSPLQHWINSQIQSLSKHSKSKSGQNIQKVKVVQVGSLLTRFLLHRFSESDYLFKHSLIRGLNIVEM